jgi:predicted phosphatase
MEKEQRIQDYNVGYTDAQCNHINDAENYVNEINYINSKEK